MAREKKRTWKVWVAVGQSGTPYLGTTSWRKRHVPVQPLSGREARSATLMLDAPKPPVQREEAVSNSERTYGSTTLEEIEALHDADGPSWPWRFEEDWTCEVYGADGNIVGKLARQGLLAVVARNALPDLLAAAKEAGRLRAALRIAQPFVAEQDLTQLSRGLGSHTRESAGEVIRAALAGEGG